MNTAAIKLLSHPRQRGAVLIIALLFLLLTAGISITLMSTSVMESKMAANGQFREEAVQKVQAVGNALIADESHFVVSGGVGYKICAIGASGCDSAIISLSAPITHTPAGVSLDYYIERQAPLLAGLPFRLDEGSASSAATYQAAIFEVISDYDGTNQQLSKAGIAQGIAMRVAAPGQ